MSAAPTTQEPPKAPAEPPPSRFEDFMSESIGTALKENPNMPSTEKERAGMPQESAPAPEAPPVAPPTEDKTAGALEAPDFSQLAFGKEIAEKVAEGKAHLPATTTPETKVEAITPPATPELTGKVTPQVEQAFGSMRKANKALFEQNATLTTELNAAKERLKEFEGKMPMDKDEFGRLSAEREALIQDLRLVKLEATPEYKAAITRPMEQIEGELHRLAGKYSINEHQMRRAITEADPDKQSELLGQVTETFNDRDKLNLFKIADASLEIASKKTILLKDVQQALKYIETKHTAETEARNELTRTEWGHSLGKAWEAVGEALYLARPMDGNEQWNNSLKEMKDLVAKTDLAALQPIDRAKVMVQAALLPRACMVIQQLWNMYAEANKVVQRYRGVTPAAGGGNSGAGTEIQQPKMPDETSFVDAIEARIKGVH
jgi:transposase-like protein